MLDLADGFSSGYGIMEGIFSIFYCYKRITKAIKTVIDTMKLNRKGVAEYNFV